MLYAVETFEITDNATMTTVLPTTFSTIIRSALNEFRGIIGEHDEVLPHRSFTVPLIISYANNWSLIEHIEGSRREVRRVPQLPLR
jgi:hypothetical protein